MIVKIHLNGPCSSCLFWICCVNEFLLKRSGPCHESEEGEQFSIRNILLGTIQSYNKKRKEKQKINFRLIQFYSYFFYQSNHSRSFGFCFRSRYFFCFAFASCWQCMETHWFGSDMLVDCFFGRVLNMLMFVRKWFRKRQMIKRGNQSNDFQLNVLVEQLFSIWSIFWYYHMYLNTWMFVSTVVKKTSAIASSSLKISANTFENARKTKIW